MQLVTVQEFSDQLSIHLAKMGARVKVQVAHSTSIYLLAKYRNARHSIRISDHAPGKRWVGGLNATNVPKHVLNRVEGPAAVAASVMGYLRDRV